MDVVEQIAFCENVDSFRSQRGRRKAPDMEIPDTNKCARLVDRAMDL